ncbi:hypothetical protein [Geoalkalibacter halelectricus]|uniref:Uncharacterized protein n=1 Tax=Geoalkalibacter halelectricus TaxID=2847045 RepID=A0ABY5ZK59_9BACT|nr:hypothetical protein [Geoalkalibacter halelectricus]MDO3380262.1 hypothetical protein [Geoalkalibacter halelectricus]UWZ79530.1 hypothetical protein L9S41_17890 [Geoalkalibacter halelectricus]
MFRISVHGSIISSIVLLIFLFSANGLLFGSHAAKEIFSGAAGIACEDHDFASGCELHSSSHHHGHDHHSHNGTECCGTHGNHSHDFRSVQPLIVSPSLSSSQHRFFDIAVFLPEVYLERFIPPQNRA